MPSDVLSQEFQRAREAYEQAVRDLVPLAVQMALASVAEVLSGAAELGVQGEINEDWIPILRIRRVLDAAGQVLFNVDTGDDGGDVESMIDEVGVEYLDLLLDLTGDGFMGAGIIDWSMAKTTST